VTNGWAFGVNRTPEAHSRDPRDERALIGVAVALGATRGGDLSDDERAYISTATRVDDTRVAVFHDAIARGEDPLGDALCALRSAAQRRPMGATYTPGAIVTAMTHWGAARSPARVIDPATLCYDMSYARAGTSFLKWAREQGCERTAQGWGMLVEQAAESFELWRGVRPATAPVLAALLAG